MAGNSFMVTVRAPNAPCTQTHTKVAVAQAGCICNPAPVVLGPARSAMGDRQA